MRNLLRFLVSGTCLLAAQSALSATPSIVELQTNVGTITLQLNYDKAPISSANFVDYAQSGFYKDVLFHRVIKGFMAQGGGFSRIDGKQKATNPPITNEASNGLKNVTGAIAMARTSEPNSATSQFFINVVDNSFLDYTSSNAGYAVFGKVVKGMAVVKKIEGFTTYSDFPFSTVAYIENVYLSDKLNTSQSITRIMINGQGTVSSLPDGIDCGADCTLTQTTGEPLKLNTTPAKGFVFSGWSGDCQGLYKTLSLDTKKGNHNCTANFVKTSSALQ